MNQEQEMNYEDDDKPFIIGYEFDSLKDCYEMVPSNPNRDWMDETPNRFAYRCLPLIMGNSIGWQIKTKFPFIVHWNGGRAVTDLTIGFPDTDPKRLIGQRQSAISHFGSGILTFSLPFLFRTSRGHNLFAMGPTNEPKSHITPLVGIIETDWLPFTFTMNWKVTTPNTPIIFKPGDVICQFFPYPRGYPEKFTALTDKLSNNPSVNAEYKEWSESRGDFNRRLKDPNDPSVTGKDWQKNYFRGTHKDGSKFDEHQSKFNVCPFMKLPKGKETTE